MKHLAGKGVKGSHGTSTDLTYDVAEHALKIPQVKRVVPGIITMLPKRKGNFIQITFVKQTGCILLICMQAGSKQELRIQVENGSYQAVWDTLWSWVESKKWKLRDMSRE